jgi:hypothetical protein
MPDAVAERFDFFLSRRGSVGAVVQEVDDVLGAAGCKEGAAAFRACPGNL